VPATFPLDIVTPEKTVLSEVVTSVQLPAVTGSMGVLAGHAPLLAELGVGECVVKMPSGAEEQFLLSGGFVEVSREKVTILADTAERADEIDVNRAEAALARVREMLVNIESLPADQREDASAAMRRAQARLRIARGGQG
jgi:F-type H+-transporting ATPase subunit epsilon